MIHLMAAIFTISYGVYEIRKVRQAQESADDLDLVDRVRLVNPKSGWISLSLGIVLLATYVSDSFGV